MANHNFVRIKDVAEACGVSMPTVSDVLNGKAKQKRIADSTAEKVLATARKLNYKVNLQARNMIRGRSYTIGAVFCRLDNSFYSKIFHGFYDVCLENNCSPLVFISDWNHEKEKKAIDQLIGMRVDGIAISPACTKDSASTLKHLVEQNIPVCLFEQGKIPGADYVGFDNHSGIFDAVMALAKRGYKKIHIILRDNSSQLTKERLGGYQEGLEAAGLGFDAGAVHYIYEAGIHNIDYFQCGYETTIDIMNSVSRPEALICLNDEFALGVYHAAEELDLKIPDDLAVIGYGNRDFSSHLQPSLSTVDQGLRSMGENIGLQLFTRIEDRQAEVVNTLIRTPLIERNSF